MESTPSRGTFRSALFESRGAALVSIVLLVVGVLLRLRLYTDRRSVWLDEAWVSLNIVERDFLGMIADSSYRVTRHM